MFIPKNINKRVENLKKMQAKELLDYEKFIKEFSKNLTTIQGKTSVDEKEQLFIDLIQNCVIKTYQIEYPFKIYLFKDDEFMFQYDWKNDTFWYSYDRVWSVFRDTFKICYQECQRFIADQVEIHFKFRPSTTLLGACASWLV